MVRQIPFRQTLALHYDTRSQCRNSPSRCTLFRMKFFIAWIQTFYSFYTLNSSKEERLNESWCATLSPPTQMLLWMGLCTEVKTARMGGDGRASTLEIEVETDRKIWVEFVHLTNLLGFLLQQSFKYILIFSETALCLPSMRLNIACWVGRQ